MPGRDSGIASGSATGTIASVRSAGVGSATLAAGALAAATGTAAAFSFGAVEDRAPATPAATAAPAAAPAAGPVDRAGFSSVVEVSTVEVPEPGRGDPVGRSPRGTCRPVRTVSGSVGAAFLVGEGFVVGAVVAEPAGVGAAADRFVALPATAAPAAAAPAAAAPAMPAAATPVERPDGPRAGSSAGLAGVEPGRADSVAVSPSRRCPVPTVSGRVGAVDRGA
jgi:hypothetical protein